MLQRAQALLLLLEVFRTEGIVLAKLSIAVGEDRDDGTCPVLLEDAPFLALLGLSALLVGAVLDGVAHERHGEQLAFEQCTDEVGSLAGKPKQ